MKRMRKPEDVVAAYEVALAEQMEAQREGMRKAQAMKIARHNAIKAEREKAKAKTRKARSAWGLTLAGRVNGPNPPDPTWRRVLHVMQPGQWYDVKALAELVGRTRMAVAWALQTQLDGAMDVAEIDPRPLRRNDAVYGTMGKKRLTRHAFRLNAQGERARQKMIDEKAGAGLQDAESQGSG